VPAIGCAELGLPPAALADAGIVVAGAEFDYGLERFATILREARLTFLMPDVKHCGGVGVAATVGAMAAGHGIRLSPHNPSGPVATVASMHVCATASNFEMLEYQWAEVPARESMISPVEPRVGGMLKVSDAPGFGITLDREALDSLALPLD
jgi:galactonate dehydratase